MFTGMIEEVGRVRAIQRRGGYRRTTVDASRVLEDMQVGDSITLDGACQTVVALDGPGFTVESVEETLRRTRRNGLIMIDNTLRGGTVLEPGDSDAARVTAELNDRLAKDDRVDVSLLGVADGITVVRKR